MRALWAHIELPQSEQFPGHVRHEGRRSRRPGVRSCRYPNGRASEGAAENPVAALPASHNDLCVQSVQVTQRLTLRQFTPADADDLLSLDGDPRVMRFLEPKTKTRAQIQAEVLPRFLA